MRAAGRGDLHIYGDAKNSHAILAFLHLLDAESELMLGLIEGVAEVKLRRAGSVNPLTEELVDIGVRGFFDGLGKIGSQNIFAAIRFQIMFQPGIERIFTKLV